MPLSVSKLGLRSGSRASDSRRGPAVHFSRRSDGLRSLPRLTGKRYHRSGGRAGRRGRGGDRKAGPGPARPSALHPPTAPPRTPGPAGTKLRTVHRRDADAVVAPLAEGVAPADRIGAVSDQVVPPLADRRQRVVQNRHTGPDRL